MNKIVYDLIFGIGEACSCTQVLRKAGLQESSFPFDWLFGSDFEGRIDILISEFADFINEQDLSFAGYNNGDKKNLCDVYANKHNNIFFNHDFPSGVDAKKSFPTIAEKYNRRIARLLDKIQNANNILIVYLETPIKNHTAVSDKTIIAGYSRIVKKFGKKNKKINLIYFSNKTGQECPCEVVLVDGVKKIVMDYKSKKPDAYDYAVENKKIVKIIQRYKLKKTLKNKLKKVSIKLFTNLIPIKSLRKKMKAKYHVV